MRNSEKFWCHGEKKRIADLLRIHPVSLTEVLHRKRGVSIGRAKLLERASKVVLGHAIPFNDWLLNSTTTHPAFYGHPHNTALNDQEDGSKNHGA